MTVCAILLSYRRPQNIQKILSTLRSVPLIDEIILSNNNPDIDLHQWASIGMAHQFIQQSQHEVCGKRFEIAVENRHDHYFFPDDDIFLSEKQIESLIGKLLERSDKVHGVFGQLRLFKNGLPEFADSVHGIDCELDVLNRAYACSRSALGRMSSLCSSLGLSGVGDTRHIDDLVLSFSGSGRPMCHNLGALEECPTSSTSGIATYQEEGFRERRLDVYARLCELTERPRLCSRGECEA